MQPPSAPLPSPNRSLLGNTILILLLEKTVQHFIVSLAFLFNWKDIAATVVIEPAVLIVLGFILMILFGVAFFGLLRRKRWAAWLALVLAVLDIIGEFVAQGILAISITFSFLVAGILAILLFVYIHRQAGYV